MKAQLSIILFMFNISMTALSQNSDIELIFTADNNGAYVQIDSIRIMNRTQGGDTVLFWPDTVLWIYHVGMHENPWKESAFQVFQNYPNPVADQTTVSLFVPEKDKVSIMVTDILGRMIVQSERVLDKGKHSFRFTPGSGSLFCFTARWQGESSSIEILHSGFHSGRSSTLEYTGIEAFSPQLRAMKDIQDFSYTPGDELLYIGHANGLQSGMIDVPQESTNYSFQFATNIPCPGTPIVEYEGQIYNTIQIFSQCWLKENLNVGERIDGTMEQSNNGAIEKYCYKNEPDSCAKYGGLYQWNEMMQYTTQQGTQGICPPGWHLPTDEEWKVLEGVVDSQYGIGDPEWDRYSDCRGFDAGTNMKKTSGWFGNGNGTDLLGFAGLPGGLIDADNDFQGVGTDGTWWVSSVLANFDAWTHAIDYQYPGAYRTYYIMEFGFSVRCVRD